MVKVTDTIDEYTLLVLLKNVLIPELCPPKAEEMMKKTIEFVKCYAWTSNGKRLVKNVCTKYYPNLMTGITDYEKCNFGQTTLTYVAYIKYILDISPVYRGGKLKKKITHVLMTVLFTTDDMLYNILQDYPKLAETVYEKLNGFVYEDNVPEFNVYLNKYKELELRILLF